MKSALFGIFLETCIERVGIQKVEHIDFCQALPVIFRFFCIGRQSALNMFPMFIEGFIKIVSEGFLPLVDHGLANGFYFFDHDDIEAFGFL
jgi:hypothetical protein